MPQTLILGSQASGGNQLAIDPAFQAARAALRPIDHTGLGQILGHYRASAITGTTVSIGAGGILAYLRWQQSQQFAVMMRCSISAIIAATITTGTVVDAGCFVARGSSAAGSGGNAITLTGSNGKNRATMGTSLMTDARVATTGALTAPTGATQDAQACGTAVTPLSGQTATTTAPGPKIDLYKWDALGQHPIVLTSGDVFEVAEITAGPVTGGIKWYIDFEWAEVVAF